MKQKSNPNSFQNTFKITNWPHHPWDFTKGQATLAVIISLVYEQVWELFFLNSANSHHHAAPYLTLAILTIVEIMVAATLWKQIPNIYNSKPAKQNYYALPLYITSVLCLGVLWTIVARPLLAINQIHLSGNQITLDAYAKLPGGLPFLAIATILLAPPIEEFVFRSTIIGNPKTRRQTIIRVTVSILLFAFLHMVNQLVSMHTGADIRMAIFNFGQYAIIAGGLSWTYVTFRSYHFNVCFHALWNLLTLLLMIH